MTAELTQLITQAVESILELNDKNKYNVSLGYFQCYSKVDVDPLGNRFADIKLHYKDENGEDIGGIDVPLIYFGNENTVDDFALEKGSDLAVFFTDRTLEQWVTGAEPQALRDKVKDSKNHAFAIPISTHHTFGDIATAAIDSTVGRRILVKPGKKIQIGNGTDELLDLIDQILTALADAAVQNIGSGSTPGPLINQATFLTIQTVLANLKF